MLYTMIAEAWGVPLGNDKCIVERDKALGLLDDLKAVLPMELSEARRLVNARDEFVNTAKQEAESIRRSAEEEANRLLENQTVYQAAQKKAEESLEKGYMKSAADAQKEAAEKLDEAKQAMSEGEKKDQEEQQPQQQQPQEDQQDGSEEQMSETENDIQNILDQERNNQRRKLKLLRIKPVEKDW